MTMKRMKLDFSWDDISKISQSFDNKGRYDWFHQTKFGSIAKHTWKTDFLTSEVQFFRFKKDNVVGILCDLQTRCPTRFEMQDGDWIRFNFSLNLDMRISSPTAGIIEVRGGSGRIFNFPPNEIISERIT